MAGIKINNVLHNNSSGDITSATYNGQTVTKIISDGTTVWDKPINGGWSAWSGFGTCSVTCGGGTQSRTRTCTNPSPAYGGITCSGASSESQACNTQSCFGATWSGNSAWGSGSGIFTSGTQLRMQHGGTNGSWITSYSNKTFSSTVSGGGLYSSTGVFNAMRGFGNSQLQAGVRPLTNTYYWGDGYITLDSNGNLTGTSMRWTDRGIQTSSGNMRSRNVSSYGAWIGIS